MRTVLELGALSIPLASLATTADAIDRRCGLSQNKPRLTENGSAAPLDREKENKNQHVHKLCV